MRICYHTLLFENTVFVDVTREVIMIRFPPSEYNFACIIILSLRSPNASEAQFVLVPHEDIVEPWLPAELEA